MCSHNFAPARLITRQRRQSGTSPCYPDTGWQLVFRTTQHYAEELCAPKEDSGQSHLTDVVNVWSLVLIASLVALHETLGPHFASVPQVFRWVRDTALSEMRSGTKLMKGGGWHRTPCTTTVWWLITITIISSAQCKDFSPTARTQHTSQRQRLSQQTVLY